MPKDSASVEKGTSNSAGRGPKESLPKNESLEPDLGEGAGFPEQTRWEGHSRWREQLVQRHARPCSGTARLLASPPCCCWLHQEVSFSEHCLEREGKTGQHAAKKPWRRRQSPEGRAHGSASSLQSSPSKLPLACSYNSLSQKCSYPGIPHVS